MSVRIRLRWAVRVLLLAVAGGLLWGTRACSRWPQVYYMTGPSMEPTVRAKEYFVATGPVERLTPGALVIFRYDDGDNVYHVLRRVAGLPGDTVALRDGAAFVNGRPMGWPFHIEVPAAWRSDYVRGGNLYTWGPAVVPADSVLLLADTRDMLGFPDSRFIGPVAAASIEAIAKFTVWPRLFHGLR